MIHEVILIQAFCSNDELQRLAKLESYKILDTHPEQSYDRITKLACRLFAVPICLISLVGEKRQWFKSRCGLMLRETERNIAFCAHTILQNDVMVVPDMVLDNRFSANPMVTGYPHVRFYAGAPLRTADGHNVGTICLLGREPRTFDETEKSTLEDLAGIVVHEMELRFNAKALSQANEQLAHQATHDPLTGLANRSLFDQFFHTAVLLAAFQHTQIGILYMDLDGFKAVNDNFGHAVGDLLLQNFAIRLAAIMPEHSTFCRIGGDEFAVLVPNLSADQEHLALARQIACALETPFHIERHEILIGISIGSAVYPRDGETPHALLQLADMDMYKAKCDLFGSSSSGYNELDGSSHADTHADDRGGVIRQRFFHSSR